MKFNMNKKKLFIIALGLVALGIFVFLLKDDFSQFTKGSKNYVASGILYHTTLTRNEAGELSGFLKDSLREEYVPEELRLESVLDKDGTEEFKGTWRTEDNKLLTVLYVSDKKEHSPLYMRVWRMHEEPGLNSKISASLLGGIFNEEFLTSIGEVECRDRVLENNPPVTECARMQKQTNGEIIGITLHSPVAIEGFSITGTAVAACLVPKEKAGVYLAPICI